MNTVTTTGCEQVRARANTGEMMGAMMGAVVSALAALTACTAPAGEDTAAAEQAIATTAAAPASEPKAHVAFDFVAHFDATTNQLPHDVVLHDGNAFVVLNPTGQVLEVTPEGTVSTFGTLPVPYPFAASTNAILFTPAGDALVSVGTFSAAVTSGIYRIPAAGGAATLWASSPAMPFPNGLTYVGDKLLVADSMAGAVLAVDPAGHVTTWAQDPLFVGAASCPGANPSYVFGASGIATDGKEVVVTNADAAIVVRVPVLCGGTAGTAAALAGPDCTRFAGADHLVSKGPDWVVAANRLNSIVRVKKNGKSQTIATGGNLDFPSSVTFGRFGSRDGFLVTNFAIVPNGDAPPGAGLLFAPSN
jgi:hypothetical protein